jgi:uncharacterized membrane protein YphA (DoxX/SURF4 family)
MKSAVKAERNRSILYWLTTAILAMELLVGGAWDVLMLPQVREVVHRVGYPVYFLVILGAWKILGSIAIIIPRFPRLKKWAYAVLASISRAHSHQTLFLASTMPPR